jgi:hypothetical protein
MRVEPLERGVATFDALVVLLSLRVERIRRPNKYFDDKDFESALRGESSEWIGDE